MVLIERLGIGSRSAHMTLAKSLEKGALELFRPTPEQLTTAPDAASLTTGAERRPSAEPVLRRDSWRASSSISVGSQEDDLRSISWILGFLRLPGVFSSYAVAYTVQLWLFKLGWPHLRHSLAVKRIVPRDSDFMKACAAGQLDTVRELALSGQGMPSNIDESGVPALHVIARHEVRLIETDGIQHAIKSGSLPLVQFLLHNGAAADDLEPQCYM